MAYSRLCFLLVYILLSLTDALVPNFVYTGRAENGSALDFDWDKIESSEDIIWHDCYSKFHCARLILPLDWRNESNPNTVALALIRLPASVPISDPSHGGTIIGNPGGPGGPGTLWALDNAEKLQIELDGPNYYEILSFDPRGIFSSQPNAYCFESPVGSEIWYDQKDAVGLFSTEYSLNYNYAAEKARGALCATTKNGRFRNGDNIRQFISTAYVARDLLEIVKKVDQASLVELSRLQGHADDRQQAFVFEPERMSKLQYFGTSYGTFLGQTFASMYPQYVGRMLLDANIDADNWVSRFESGIDDHTKIRDYFFQSCFASKSECAFYRSYDKTSENTRRRFDGLEMDLDIFPKYATGNGRAMPITRTVLEAGFLTTTYQPLFYFKPFAKFLNDLVTAENPGIPFWERPVPTKDTFSDKLLQQKYQGGEVGPAVHCSDGPPLFDETIKGFQAYLSNLTERLGLAAADLQANYKIPCWTWPASLRTKWRYEGPFEGKVPILFVNNRLDPATSITNARKMAGRFKGSVLLEQDSAGHGALWPPSSCMWEHVKHYMDTGEMPPKNTMCQPLCKPFEGPCEGVDSSMLPMFR